MPGRLVYESRTMEHVYANAYCNIGSTWADSSVQGQFRARDPSDLMLPTLQIAWPDQTTQKVTNRKWKLAEQSKSCELLGQPLFKRGWVLQERVMCHCMLHFCDRQLFWECNKVVLCESLPSGAGVPFDSEQLVKENLKNVTGWDWYSDIVSYYTMMSLTKESDVFPALSGIALQYCNTHGLDPGDYLAGLWRSRLLYGLLWTLVPWKVEHDQSSRPLAYRAPSWSVSIFSLFAFLETTVILILC